MMKYLNTNPILLLNTYANSVKSILEINQNVSNMKKHANRNLNNKSFNHKIILKKLQISKKIINLIIYSFE